MQISASGPTPFVCTRSPHSRFRGHAMCSACTPLHWLTSSLGSCLLFLPYFFCVEKHGATLQFAVKRADRQKLNQSLGAIDSTLGTASTFWQLLASLVLHKPPRDFLGCCCLRETFIKTTHCANVTSVSGFHTTCRSGSQFYEEKAVTTLESDPLGEIGP